MGHLGFKSKNSNTENEYQSYESTPILIKNKFSKNIKNIKSIFNGYSQTHYLDTQNNLYGFGSNS